MIKNVHVYIYVLYLDDDGLGGRSSDWTEARDPQHLVAAN